MLVKILLPAHVCVVSARFACTGCGECGGAQWGWGFELDRAQSKLETACRLELFDEAGQLVAPCSGQ